MKKLILLIIFALALCSCSSTKKVQREIVTTIEEVHDTIRDLHVEIVRDSIYLHDSIIVVKDTAGKTIYKEKYVYRDLWHDADVREVHDTIVVRASDNESERETDTTKTKGHWYDGLITLGILFAIGAGIVYGIKKLV